MWQRWFKGVLATIALVLWYAPVAGQVLHFTPTEVELNNQPVKVKQLHQDGQGYIWLGTSHGLLRYTGIAYEPIPVAQAPDSALTRNVSAMYEDGQQQLWVGFEDGLVARKVGRRLLPVILNGKHNNSPVAAILQTKSNQLWVATYGQGVFFGKGNRFYHIGSSQGLPDDYAYTLAEDAKGRVWVGTDRGIAIITLHQNEPKVELLNSAKGLPDNIVTSITLQPNGHLLIGMQSAGVANYNPVTKKFTIPKAAGNWNLGSVHTVAQHPKGNWLGTDSGLFWLRADGKKMTSAGAPAQKITDLLTDSEGNMWVAANTPTLYRANTAISSVPELKGQTIHAVLATRDSSIWFATNEGFFRKPPHAATQVYLSNRNKYQVVSLYEDSNGYIWLGTMGQGVLRLDPETGKYKQLTVTDGLANENVLSITGKGDELWLATLGGVSKCTIGQVNGGYNYSFRNFTQQDGLGINYIYQAFIDSRNRVWFATDGKGLTMLQNGKFTNFTEKDGLSSRTVYAVTEDRKGTIWLSTLNNGLYRFDGKSFKNYSLQHGLHDLNIAAITADAKGNILALNQQGLDVLLPEKEAVLFYGKSEGLTTPDPNLNVVSTGPDGRIWFGTQHGLFYYDPAFATTQYKAVTRLQDVQVFFKSVLGNKQKEFSHDNNHFTFTYSGLWYQNPEDVTYRVKLNGYDRDWTASRNHSITYPNLPPGHYTFQVVSSVTAQFSYSEAASYSFRIRPPFWRTYWFYGLTFMLAATGLYLFVKGREQRLRETERQEKDKVMFQFETLKSQVNPHFLFNSFNTLISTIEDDPDAAVVYVEKLSDFFRVMLTLREKDLIPLQEELALLRDYVYLQQQRYRENLQVTITVPEAALRKQIAPLTLQLLLENAIKHNIISKAKPLQVQVFERDNFVVVQNVYQPKQNTVLSTNIGLQNIRKRYQLLGAPEMEVSQTPELFIVKVPLLKEAE